MGTIASTTAAPRTVTAAMHSSRVYAHLHQKLGNQRHDGHECSRFLTQMSNTLITSRSAEKTQKSNWYQMEKIVRPCNPRHVRELCHCKRQAAVDQAVDVLAVLYPKACTRRKLLQARHLSEVTKHLMLPSIIAQALLSSYD